MPKTSLSDDGISRPIAKAILRVSILGGFNNQKFVIIDKNTDIN